VTVQDIAFFCAANFYNPATSSASGIVFLVAAIVLANGVFLLMVWMARVVNFN